MTKDVVSALAPCEPHGSEAQHSTTMKIAKRNDRSSGAFLLQNMFIRPFAKQLRKIGKAHEPGSPRLHIPWLIRRKCKITERNVEGIWLYDLELKQDYHSDRDDDGDDGDDGDDHEDGEDDNNSEDKDDSDRDGEHKSQNGEDQSNEPKQPIRPDNLVDGGSGIYHHGDRNVTDSSHAQANDQKDSQARITAPVKRVYFFAGGSWMAPPDSAHFKYLASLLKRLGKSSESRDRKPSTSGTQSQLQQQRSENDRTDGMNSRRYIITLVSCPLAPNSPAKDTLRDLTRLYAKLSTSPGWADDTEDVCLAGDSSGGNIALALTMHCLSTNASLSCRSGSVGAVNPQKPSPSATDVSADMSASSTSPASPTSSPSSTIDTIDLPSHSKGDTISRSSSHSFPNPNSHTNSKSNSTSNHDSSHDCNTDQDPTTTTTSSSLSSPSLHAVNSHPNPQPHAVKPPHSLILLCPSVNLTHEPTSSSAQDALYAADKADILETLDFVRHTASKWAGDLEKDDPLISPKLGRVRVLGEHGVEVYGIIAGHDVLGVEALEFVRECQAQRVRGRWLLWDKQMHNFQLTSPYGVTEAKKAADWVVKAIEVGGRGRTLSSCNGVPKSTSTTTSTSTSTSWDGTPDSRSAAETLQGGGGSDDGDGASTCHDRDGSARKTLEVRDGENKKKKKKKRKKEEADDEEFERFMDREFGPIEGKKKQK